MADIEKLLPIIVKWEGGYVNDKTDHGGSTNMGITLATWKAVGYDKDNDGDIDANDVKLLTMEDFKPVLKKYWDRWQGDNIQNQSLANILVDWVWGSGSWGIKIPQRMLGLKEDGVVGSKTIAALNGVDAEKFHGALYNARLDFLDNIVLKDPTQSKFSKGWKNRMLDFKLCS